MLFENENSRFRYPILIKIAMGLGGLLAGFILSRIFFLPYTVSDDSMLPAYKKGEHVYILKHVTPAVGDIVLIENPLEPGRVMLKRILGEPEDMIEIRNKVIYKNDQKFEFNWKTLSSDNRVFPMSFTPRDTMPAVKIGRNMFFIIGDNLDYSYDSRSFGPVNKKHIIGRVIFK